MRETPMLVRGKPITTMNVLMARAVEVAVLGLISYFGFLADTTKAIHDTQMAVTQLQGEVRSASAKAASCEDRINEHIKENSK